MSAALSADPAALVTTSLEDIRQLTPSAVYAPGRIEQFLTAIEAEIDAIEADATTPAGRELIRATAFRVRQTKTTLDGMGKALTEVWRQKTAAVNAARTIVRERLDALAQRIRAPLTDFEIREEQRVLEHETALRELQALTEWPAGVLATSWLIAPRLDLANRRTNRDWEEFAVRHERIRADVIAHLERLMAEAGKREADAAELAMLREQAAARAREIAEREAADRERVRVEQAAAALVAAERTAAAEELAALVAKFDREIREANEREAALKRREEAARTMAAARAADEQARVDAAVARAREDDAAAVAASPPLVDPPPAGPLTRTARKLRQDVAQQGAARIVEIGQIGEIPAHAIMAAIMDGQIPHVTCNV